MVKTIVSQFKEFKKDALLTPLFVVLEVLFEIAIPFLMAIIVDQGVAKGDLHLVLSYGIAMIFLGCGSLTVGTLAGRYAARSATGLSKNLRQAMFYNIQNFSFANIDKYSTAGLVTRLMTDVTNVQNAFQMSIRMCIRAPLMLLFCMAVIFYLNVEIGFVLLGTIIFLSIVLGSIIYFAHPLFREIFNTYDALNSVTQENINGIRVVKSFVREKHETDRFKHVSHLIYTLFKKAENKFVFNQPAMQLSMYTCIIFISWFGAKKIVVGDLSTGQMMTMFTYTSTILMSLMMLSMVFVTVIMSIASLQRISEVIQEKPSLSNPESPVDTIADGSVTFDHVSFGYYKDKIHLEDINIQIESGQTIGIIGGTGSAKTTLVQLIPRLYDVSAGSVKIGNKDVREYDLDTLRDQVSVVLQKNVLFSGTIKENLRWGNPEASDEELLRVCRLAQADEFIQRFPDGYNTYIEQGGNNVSGGQKQRLCIARALLKKPKVLILDDSTSAVDTKTESLIRHAFLEEIPDVTKIIIAQRISSVESADQIIVLQEGKIETIGTHKQLLQKSPIYQEVYALQQGGKKDETDK